MVKTVFHHNKVRRNRTTAVSKTPPLSKPPLTFADGLGLAYGFTEGVAENFQATLEFANGPIKFIWYSSSMYRLPSTKILGPIYQGASSPATVALFSVA